MSQTKFAKLDELSRLVNEIAAQIVKQETEKLEAILGTLKGLKQIKDAQDGMGTETT